MYNHLEHGPAWNKHSVDTVTAAGAAAKSLQSCLTLCDPIDGSPPGSPVPGILQERILEWAAISFSNAWKWKVKVKSLSCVRLLATSWTAAYQAPLSMGFSRQEYWSGVPTAVVIPQHSSSHLRCREKCSPSKAGRMPGRNSRAALARGIKVRCALVKQMWTSEQMQNPLLGITLASSLYPKL